VGGEKKRRLSQEVGVGLVPVRWWMKDVAS
jgi:hypothetical protein